MEGTWTRSTRYKQREVQIPQPPPPPTSHHHHLGKRLGMYIKLLYAHFVIPYQVTDLKRHCHRVFAVLKSLLCTLTHTNYSAKLKERWILEGRGHHDYFKTVSELEKKMVTENLSKFRSIFNLWLK